jgi:hypothetical protein
MEETHIINDTCSEINRIKKTYWLWFDSIVDIEKVKREGNWRINNIDLLPGVDFKYFDIDVTDWKWDEDIKGGAHGSQSGSEITGFIPKLNEFAESYFNEMTRRPVALAIETFNDQVYLFGGASCKARFSFSKGISGRNGYSIKFTNASDESSLLINDTDHFPAAPPLVILEAPYLMGLFSASITEMEEFVFDADTEGVFIDEDTDGASGTMTYAVDTGSGYGAFAAFVNPTTYNSGDKLKVKRTVGAASGWFKLKARE